jgi:hypothetical protein
MNMSDQNHTPVAPPTITAGNVQDMKTVRADQFRNYIETEVLLIIKKMASEGTTTEEKVKAIAQLTLNLIKPGMILEELYKNAVKLDDQYPELSPLVVKIMREYEEKYEKKALAYVSELVKNHQFDQAQDVVKKVLEFKMN